MTTGCARGPGSGSAGAGTRAGWIVSLTRPSTRVFCGPVRGSPGATFLTARKRSSAWAFSHCSCWGEVRAGICLRIARSRCKTWRIGSISPGVGTSGSAPGVRGEEVGGSAAGSEHGKPDAIVASSRRLALRPATRSDVSRLTYTTSPSRYEAYEHDLQVNDHDDRNHGPSLRMTTS